MSKSSSNPVFNKSLALVGVCLALAIGLASGCSSPFGSCSARRNCPLEDAAAGAADGGEAGESGDASEAGAGSAGDDGFESGGEGGGRSGESGGAGGDPSTADCGNGAIEAGEICDDGNLDAGDGCDVACAIEAGWGCSGKPSVCGQASCSGLAKACGSTGNDDCCASVQIPGVLNPPFYRSYDGVTYTDKSYPAQLTAFRLDTYEVTVGRFRKFVAAYPASAPVTGSGKNSHNPRDTGWGEGWTAEKLPASQADLTVVIQCDAKLQTWSAGNDALPMNCLNWYEAEAFCIWDGGRLPTETEWDYAAAGGVEQRVYPWGVSTPDGTLAVSVLTLGSGTKPAAVGSKPKGNGKWGQSDLAGNVWEWTQDWYASDYANPCNNCANLTPATRHSLRGGGFNSNNLSDLTASNRNYGAPVLPARSPNFGVRCARGPN